MMGETRQAKCYRTRRRWISRVPRLFVGPPWLRFADGANLNVARCGASLKHPVPKKGSFLQVFCIFMGRSLLNTSLMGTGGAQEKEGERANNRAPEQQEETTRRGGAGGWDGEQLGSATPINPKGSSESQDSPGSHTPEPQNHRGATVGLE
ncbi:hypothetical protein FALCPG4_000549 [Fusarium falciforme]